MTAIVLDHEEPHEKARGRHREQQAKPVAEIERCPHQRPEQNKRPGRNDELDDAAREVRRAIADKELRQAAGVGRNRGQGRHFRVIQDNLQGNLSSWPIDDDASETLLVITKERSACPVRIDAYCKAVSRFAHA